MLLDIYFMGKKRSIGFKDKTVIQSIVDQLRDNQPTIDFDDNHGFHAVYMVEDIDFVVLLNGHRHMRIFEQGYGFFQDRYDYLMG